jgi:hypothetical protein
MAEIPKKVSKSQVIIVEGKEDELFFDALIKNLALSDIQVLPIGGKTELRKYLKALIRVSGFDEVRSLGIARDANSDPRAALQSVKDALGFLGLPVPERALLPFGDKLKVVIMIFPDENTPGMLEDLCLRAVMQDPAMFCVDQYFQCLQQKGMNLPSKISKAKVQVFLGSRPEPGKLLGVAAQAGYWPFDVEAFAQVRTFIQKLARE